MSFRLKIFVFLIALIHGYEVSAQLSGTVNVGSGQTYTSLTNAGGLFQTINTVGISGNLIARITSDILNESGSVSLNQWAGTNTVNIVPSAATLRTLSGTDTGCIFKLNGADRVKFDGRFGGAGKYLKFVNQNAAGTTFRFINDATLDTLTYCLIQSQNAVSNEGTIEFKTTTGANGNDNNVISFCDISDIIGSAGATPINAIYSKGTFSTTARYNSNISILSNNIFNFYRNGQNCDAIYLDSGSTDWTISGNSFYQTATRNNANATGWNIIYVVTSHANNLTISNNFFGGTAASCGGTPWTISGNVSNYFYAVRFANGGTTTASNINGNTIANIDFTSNPANTGAIYFVGIEIEIGKVNIGTTTGNTIGNSTSNSSIKITYTGATSNVIARGIDNRGTGSINNNTVGSFDFGGTNTTGIIRMEAIYYAATPSAAVTINNNTVGSTTIAGSIRTTANIVMQMAGIFSSVNGVGVTINGNTVYNLSNTSTNNNARQRGIYQNVGTTGQLTMNNNTIAELSCAGGGNDRFPNNCALVGLFTGSSYNNQVVSGNTIRGLRGSGTVDNYVEGFAPYNDLSVGTFRNNKIYDLTNTSTSAAPKIWGINSFWGQWNYYNNQITITNGEATLSPAPPKNVEPVTTDIGERSERSSAGNTAAYLIRIDATENAPYNHKHESTIQDAFTNRAELKGIHEEDEFGAVYYYNSVYVGGSAASGNTSSWVFDRPLTSWPTPVLLRNNLFVNARTGGTGSHFVIGNEITPPGKNWPDTASRYNVFINANANTVGMWGTTPGTITNWRDSSFGDRLTWCTTTANINPSNLFTNISTGDLNINSSNAAAWIVSGKGIAIAGLNTDFGGTARVTTIAGGCTDIGSDEFAATPPGNPVATFDNAPGSGVTSTYTLWNRTIATIIWNSGGTSYPTAMNVKYFSGVNHPNATMGGYSNSYWNFVPVGSFTGTSYDITIFFGDNETYTISNPSANSRNAKYVSTWEVYSTSGNGQYQTELNWAGKWAKTRGPNAFASDYVLTDGSNPLPVQMCSFSGNAVNRSVSLNWVTCSEYNNMGFDVERKAFNSTTNQYGSWVKIGFVQGKGNSTEESYYKFDDSKLTTGKYQYRLKQIDFNGNFEYHNLTTPSDVVIGKPVSADMSQNYPNPSNPTTKVDFQIPFDAKVSLKVYDMTGQEVAVLINSELQGGYYTSEFNGTNIASGVYFYRLIATAGDGQKFSKTMKMVLIK